MSAPVLVAAPSCRSISLCCVCGGGGGRRRGDMSGVWGRWQVDVTHLCLSWWQHPPAEAQVRVCVCTRGAAVSLKTTDITSYLHYKLRSTWHMSALQPPPAAAVGAGGSSEDRMAHTSCCVHSQGRCPGRGTTSKMYTAVGMRPRALSG